jgi:hypothetical protein
MTTIEWPREECMTMDAKYDRLLPNRNRLQGIRIGGYSTEGAVELEISKLLC